MVGGSVTCWGSFVVLFGLYLSVGYSLAGGVPVVWFLFSMIVSWHFWVFIMDAVSLTADRGFSCFTIFRERCDLHHVRNLTRRWPLLHAQRPPFPVDDMEQLPRHMSL